MFPILGEAGSNDDLSQSVKPKPAEKTNPFLLLEDEDNRFPDQKAKKNEPKSNSQQDVDSKADDIFWGWHICYRNNQTITKNTPKTKQQKKTREKEKTFEPILLDHNIDIFVDLTVKPKEKYKDKVKES